MDRICVYCGSRPGRDPAYRTTARALGEALARRDLGLVFGGGHVGLMGVVADATLAGGGEAHGVIPEPLVDRELAHDGLTALDVVPSMHARKERMAELADGFVALPGGYGTLEELVEMLTWAQLGFHRDPCGFLNAAGYYTRLIAFLDHQVEEGFVSEAHREMVVVAEDPESMLDAFAAYQPPPVKRFITDERQT